MGKKNPLKEVTRAVTDTFVNPIRETARAIGADGAVDFLNEGKGKALALNTGLIDKASGKSNQLKKEASAARAKSVAEADALEAGRQRAIASAETNRIEGERMSAGSKSRTLLTGPAGLENEDDSITKRTLLGF